MNYSELIALIEKEWDLDSGFLGMIREGRFDREAHNRCKQALERIRLESKSEEYIPRRLVSLVWYIPLFMSWQTERVKSSIDIAEYHRAANEFQTKVQEILGVP
jgi:hypothetical protein